MSAEMIESIRNEAFVQGWIKANCTIRGFSTVGDVPDHELLRMLPIADKAYTAWRKTRTP